MNWKSLFLSRILFRGREYCLDESIEKMECDCPYAQDGKTCVLEHRVEEDLINRKTATLPMGI